MSKDIVQVGPLFRGRIKQQAAAIVLKTRGLLVRQKTQAINALRAHLSEVGVIVGTGTAKVTGLIDIVRDDRRRRRQ